MAEEDLATLLRVSPEVEQLDVEVPSAGRCVVKARRGLGSVESPLGGVDPGGTLSGVAVRYRVVSGIAVLAEPEVTVATGDDGTAAIDLIAPRAGTALVEAGVADGDSVVYFRVQTAGTVASLELECEEGGSVASSLPVRVLATDHQGNPVEKAQLVLEAACGCERAYAEPLELGQGFYEGTFLLRKAGRWILTAQDIDSGAIGRAGSLKSAADPVRVQVGGELDPRQAPPFEQAALTARLVDAWDNSLDPGRLQCWDGEAELPLETDGELARFSVNRDSPGAAEVWLRDSESEVAAKRSVVFADAWIPHPGFVKYGSEFTTPLFAVPPGRDSWSLHVAFSGEMVDFQGVEVDPDSGWDIVERRQVDGVTLELRKSDTPTTEPPGAASHLGELQWRCEKVGETCLSVHQVADPSPDYAAMTTTVGTCFGQKMDRPFGVRVNLMALEVAGGGPSDLWLKSVGAAARNAWLTALNPQTLALCCPMIWLHPGYRRISRPQWARLTAGFADESIHSQNEFWTALGRLQMDPKLQPLLLDYAINILIIDLEWWANIGGQREEVRANTNIGRVVGTNMGFGVLKPSALRDPASGKPTDPEHILAHEIGHALALVHALHHSGHLMYRTGPRGTGLSVVDCNMLAKSGDWYPGFRPLVLDPLPPDQPFSSRT